MKRVGLAALVVLAAATPALAQPQRFQSGVELLPIDGSTQWISRLAAVDPCAAAPPSPTLARRHTEQYAALNGTRQLLVNVWVDYLER